MEETSLGTVLIIDDSKKNLRLMTSVLESEGYKVLQALSGHAGLKVAMVGKPDLVLMDIRMPEVDGYETCREFKANPELKPIPVVFLSGLTEQREKLKAFQEGGVDYIEKPIQAQEVLARVKTHIQLYRMQTSLNAMVKARTQQLEKANQILKSEIRQRDNLAMLVDERTTELEEAKKAAETANRTKSLFLANMSHEIRTPMNSVLGFIQVVLESHELSDEHLKYLQTAYNSATNLLIIINDILDVSKLEIGKLTLETACFNLPNTVEKILTILALEANSKGIALDFHFDDNLPHCYMGDPTRIGQVIMNLVNNAIKFTKKGCVTVTVKPSDKGEDFLHFSVEDTGIGMTAEQAANVFIPFMQADLSIARFYGGTGLGLTIVKQIVELMGGWVWAENEFNKGSIFHFIVKLPATPCNAGCINHGAVMDSLKPRSPRLFRILLVEDVLENATLAKLRLKQQGHSVSHVWNGRQAVEAYEKGVFDLILMDVMMPEMDGMEATQKIREIEKGSGRHITIIALTANIMKDDMEEYLKSGMDALIGKPIVLKELFNVMEVMVPEGLGKLNAGINLDLQAESKVDLTSIVHVVDIAKGLAVWQDSLVFAESLTNFADKHSEDADKIKQLVGDENSKEAKMIVHTLKGLAGNLYLFEVAWLARKIDASLKAGNSELSEKLIPNLKDALQNACGAIGKLKMPEVKKIGKPTMAFDSKAVTILLQELFNMLDEDNPALVEPIINKLSEYVSQKDMDSVRQAVDGFDFDRAKFETRILAEKIGVKV